MVTVGEILDLHGHGSLLNWIEVHPPHKHWFGDFPIIVIFGKLQKTTRDYN